MQCVLREKLLAQALKLTSVSDVYRRESHRFVEALFVWFDETEKEVAGLRSPISILLQAEKSKLSSVADGYLPSTIQRNKSARKNQRAVAALTLSVVSKEIYSTIEKIDLEFQQLSEKLSHAIAVLANQNNTLYEWIRANPQNTNELWRMLGDTPETKPFYDYFCVKITATDRNYLLTDAMHNVVQNSS